MKVFEQPAPAISEAVPTPHRNDSATVSFGAFRFDLANGLLRDAGGEIPLPPRAIAVLTLLVRRRGHVVGKKELLDTVWKDVTVEEASLKEAISALRQALGDDPKQPLYIQTVHRRGYRFVAETVIDEPAVPRTAGTKRGRSSWAAALAVGVVAGAAGGWWWRSAIPVPAGPPIRFVIAPPAGDTFEVNLPAVAVTRDGRLLAFVAGHGETDHLYLRKLAAAAPVLVADSDNALTPFFSPDGQWVGFCSAGALKITPVAGGAVTTLANGTDCEGASWGPNGRIVFGGDDGLWSVSAEGGAPKRLTRIAGGGETGHWWPEVLPDGSVLFTVWHTVLNDAEIALLRPGAGDYRIVFTGGSDPHYLPDGRLLVARQGGATVLPFDLSTGEVTGPPVASGAHVLVDSFMGFAQFAVAADGTRATITGAPAAAAHLVWADMSGNVSATALPARDYRNANLARDGRHAAVTINAPNNYDIWVGDLARGTLTRLTTQARNTVPVWSPEGRWIAYAYSGDGPFAIMYRRADGSGRPEELASGPEPPYPLDFSPDGHELVFGRMSSTDGEDLWMLALDGTGRAQAFLRTPANETGARFSPDGRWIAYMTDVSGRAPDDYQIFLRTFPDSGRAWPVSVGSGENPVWAPDGRTIYYQQGGWIMAVALRLTVGTPGIGEPRRLFQSNRLLLKGIAPDGKHLLMIDSGATQRTPRQLLVEVSG